MENTAASQSAHEKILARLQPFSRALVRKAKLAERGNPIAASPDDPEAFVWLKVEQFQALDRELLEALELLALLAHVDWSLWKRFIHSLWGNQGSRWEELLDERPAPIGIHVSLDKGLREVLATVNQPEVSSTAFQETKRYILDALESQGVIVDEIPVRIGGDVAPIVGTDLVTLSQIISSHNAAAVAGIGDSSSQPVYRGLRIRAVRLGHGPFPEDAARLESVAKICACGATVDYTGLASSNLKQQHPHKFMDIMRQLFPVHDSVDGQHHGGLWLVQLGSPPFKEPYIAILSAVA